MVMSIPHRDSDIYFLLNEYQQFLINKAEGTAKAYLRTANHLLGWLVQEHDNKSQFQISQLTKADVELYLGYLEQEGLSLNHRMRVKSSISHFAQFLIEEKRLLQRNPTRDIELPSLTQHPPQPLSPEQRSILRTLVKQADDQRGSALFALGYWAGCRVSEVSNLQMAHIDTQEGYLYIDHRKDKRRSIRLLHQVRKPLYAYLQSTDDPKRVYVFQSQRGERLTEEGIHYWFRTLKSHASESQKMLIRDITFHNLRYDFIYRAKEAGWSLEDIARYLGQITRDGFPTLQIAIPAH
jgi:site-specific recombinase XerD